MGNARLRCGSCHFGSGYWQLCQGRRVCPQTFQPPDALPHCSSIRRRCFDSSRCLLWKGLTMVVLNKIYTKTGVAGTTALGNGARVEKHALRVNAYGTVDETNATVGLARQHSTGEMDAQLAAIQNDLFDLGADLCRPDMEKDAEAEYQPLRMTPAQVARLEAEIDAMNDALEPLRSFILPGGSALAAQLHLCRTVSRRAERMTVELAGQEAINASALQYLNRLSDWFFVAGRIANDDGRADILWIPGANR